MYYCVSPDIFIHMLCTLCSTCILAENAGERRISAYELVDWVRFVNPVMSSEQLLRLSNAIFRFHPSAVRDLYLNVDPAREEFWEWLGGEPSGRQER